MGSSPEYAKVYNKKWRESSKGRAYHKAWKASERGKLSNLESKFRCLYGITLVEYDQMIADQGGGCKICMEPPGKKRLAVDHDHKTGRVRGLLCLGCNTALGNVKDNPVLLRRLADHIE